MVIGCVLSTAGSPHILCTALQGVPRFYALQGVPMSGALKGEPTFYALQGVPITITWESILSREYIWSAVQPRLVRVVESWYTPPIIVLYRVVDKSGLKNPSLFFKPNQPGFFSDYFSDV